MRRRPVPEGIRITKVGLWYVLFAVLVSVAATNTGNNALYLVLAVMLALLVVSGTVSRHNLRGLEVALDAPGELFANQPAALDFVVRNPSRLTPRWALLFQVTREAVPLLLPFLPRRGLSRGRVDLMFRRRGRHRIEHAHLSTLFPLGFFRKGLRYPVGLDLLVYPELYPAAAARLGAGGRWGDESSRRVGWGHELHALRAFRPGDDPRGIHWKQTARTGDLVYMEREAEEGRRLAIVLDNAVGELSAARADRFERLVSEAATAAVDHLERGWEVELITREAVVPFGSGLLQRSAVLETLALVATGPRRSDRLEPSDPYVPELRLSLVEEEAA